MTLFEELHELPADQLNQRLQGARFRAELRSQPYRSQGRILDLLCRHRLQDVSPESRGALIKALQKGVTSRTYELAIRSLFLGTEGPDLTRVKRMIDRGDSHRDLAQLIFHDIDVLPLRRQILDHFQSQAALHPSSEVRIMSDLDDTIYRNWVDPRFPKRTVYPGVLQLYRELDTQRGGEVGDVVILTGRGGERTGIAENYYRRRLGALGIKEITMLTGTFVHQFVHPWVFSRKWANLEKHRLLYPEMKLVMFGDTGQADPEFISEACEKYPQEVSAGLLHEVLPLRGPRRERCLTNDLILFRTHVGAALELHNRGLLEPDGVWRVVEAAFAEMKKIRWDDDAQRLEREQELAADVARVMEQVPTTAPSPSADLAPHLTADQVDEVVAEHPHDE